MVENIKDMMKKAEDAFVNNEMKNCLELCNQILVLDTENPNAKIMKAAILITAYEDENDESDLDNYDDYSLDKAEKTAKEVLELLTRITRTDDITEDDKDSISSAVLSFLGEWSRQSLIHGHNSKNNDTENLLVTIMNFFPSKIEKQQKEKMKLFLEKISQLPWLQHYPRFLEEVADAVKDKYKIVNDVAKRLIDVNKDKDGELGIATKKLKKAVSKKRIAKGIKWAVFGLIIILIINVL